MDYKNKIKRRGFFHSFIECNKGRSILVPKLLKLPLDGDKYNIVFFLKNLVKMKRVL